MSDSTLNQFHAEGTASQRAAFTPAPPAAVTGFPTIAYFWFETDTGFTYVYNTSTSAWVQTSGTGLGTVTHSGTVANLHFAIFDGTTGDIIKDGGGSTGTGNVVLDTGATLTTPTLLATISAAVLINQNVTNPPPAPPAGTSLQVVGLDAIGNRVTIDAYGGTPAPNLTMRKARGTAAAPALVMNADALFQLSAFGYDGVAFQGAQGQMNIRANQDWTTSARGTEWELALTPNGSTTQTSNVVTATTALFHTSTTDNTMAGTLEVTGAVTFSSTLSTGTITGTSATFSGTLGVSGTSALHNTTATSLTVSGTTGLTGALTATSGTFSTTLGVTGAVTLSSTLGVTGGTTLSTVQINSIATVGTNTGAGSIFINGPTATVRPIRFETAGVLRWLFGVNNATETGTGNTGSDFVVNRYDDSGTLLGAAFTVTRSSGLTVFSNAVTVNGVLLPNVDNTFNLGSGTFRWGTVFAGTGTINTSDAREKSQLMALSPTELAVAKTLAAGISSYQWQDAIAAKGQDKARLHIGVTAQAVQSAFAAQGLDANRYGMFTYDEWADQPALLDGDGNVLTPAVSAGNRYGVRYDELAMFILAAQEQRLATLESRLSSGSDIS